MMPTTLNVGNETTFQGCAFSTMVVCESDMEWCLPAGRIVFLGMMENTGFVNVDHNDGKYKGKHRYEVCTRAVGGSVW